MASRPWPTCCAAPEPEGAPHVPPRGPAPKVDPSPSLEMDLITGPIGRTLLPMTTQRTSRLLAGPDGRALLASSILARSAVGDAEHRDPRPCPPADGVLRRRRAACGAYAIGGALASPVLGRLVDRRGQTRVLLFGATLSALALIVTGLLPADSPPALLIALAGATGLATPPLEACVRTLLPAIVSGPSELPRCSR